MDTQYAMKIELTNNILLLTFYSRKLQEKVTSTNFFTPYYDKANKFYCLFNNTAINFFNKNRKFFDKYADGMDIIPKEPIDYTEKKAVFYPLESPKGITLKDYQETAVNYMLERKKLCLFMGTGTGKTYMAIAYLHTIDSHEVSGTHVIIMPNNIVDQYITQLKKWLSKNFIIFNDPRTFESPTNTDNHHVLVTNYEKMKHINIDMIDNLIFDESQHLKEFTSNANAHARRLRDLSENIYNFTGTPQDAEKYELFAQFSVISKRIIPNKTLFINRYYDTDDYYKPKNIKYAFFEKELDEIIAKISYGDLPKNLLKLPDEKNIMVKVKMEDKTHYNAIQEKGIVQKDGYVITAESPGAVRMKQRQLVTGFMYDEDKNVVRFKNYKRSALKSIVATLNHGIIFTEFTPNMKDIAEVLDEEGKTYGMVSGKTKNNAETIVKFKNAEIDFLIIQTRAGNAGLDLLRTNNVIFYSLPESGLVFRQAKGRIMRMGQKKTCHYYYILVKGTVETLKQVPNLKLKEAKHVEQFDLYRRKLI